MNKKLLTMIAGSVLAAVLLAGCGVNDQEPPPENDINQPGVNDNDLDRNNDVNDNDLDRNDDVNDNVNDNDLDRNNDVNDNDLDMNDNTDLNKNNDINTDNKNK